MWKAELLMTEQLVFLGLLETEQPLKTEQCLPRAGQHAGVVDQKVVVVVLVTEEVAEAIFLKNRTLIQTWGPRSWALWHQGRGPWHQHAAAQLQHLEPGYHWDTEHGESLLRQGLAQV